MVFPMVGMGVLFLGFAAVAALFGFGGVGEDGTAGRVFAAYFLCAAVAAFWWGWLARTRFSAEPARF